MVNSPTSHGDAHCKTTVQPRPPRLVVVDVDTGTDDGLALLMLLAADAAAEVRLLGVTCVSGNTTIENVCRNTLRLLKVTGRLDVPVFAGADRPLMSDRALTNTYHGKDGFGDLDYQEFSGNDDALDQHLQQENAIVFLDRIVSEYPGQVTLVCLAPLTNIALALRTYRHFGDRLGEVHIMGGNVRGHGNVTPTAEFNFGADPEAAHIVLEGVKCPVQVTPWEPCAEHPITMDWRFTVFPASRPDDVAMAMLTAAERSVLAAQTKPLWVCCDQLAVAALLRPAVVTRSLRRHVVVELAGNRTRGQMVPACLCQGPLGECTPDCDRSVVAPARILDGFDLEGYKELLLWTAQLWTRKDS